MKIVYNFFWSRELIIFMKIFLFFQSPQTCWACVCTVAGGLSSSGEIHCGVPAKAL